MEAMRVEILYLLKIWQKDLLHVLKRRAEAYNLASGVETTIKNLAECINELTENKTPVDLKPARDWDRSGKRFWSNFKIQRKIKFLRNCFHKKWTCQNS